MTHLQDRGSIPRTSTKLTINVYIGKMKTKIIVVSIILVSLCGFSYFWYQTKNDGPHEGGSCIQDVDCRDIDCSKHEGLHVGGCIYQKCECIGESFSPGNTTVIKNN